MLEGLSIMWAPSRALPAPTGAARGFTLRCGSSACWRWGRCGLRKLLSLLRVLTATFALVLAGCASQAPLPAEPPTLALPMQLHVQRAQAGQTQDWLLVIQQDGPALRWSLMDPLGIPLARQRLANQQWQADGLLPPNPAARELFAALLFALTSEAQLHTAYPQATGTAAQRQLATRWQVRYRTPGIFSLQLPEGLTYQVSPLNTENAP